MKKTFRFLNKALYLIMAVFLLIGVLPFYASAEETALPSTVKYTITDGEVAITKCTCQTSSKDIVIPETIEGYPVTEIKSGAFGSCFNHKHFSVPATVKTIGDAAFATNNLASVIVDENNHYFSSDEYGLYNKDKTEYIQYFYGRNETDFTIPSSVKTIRSRAFEYAALISITIPEGIEVISHSAFYNCNKLEKITLPDSLTTVDNYAFQNCRSLKEISLGKNLSSFGFQALAGTRLLNKINVSDENTIFFTDDTGALYSRSESKLKHYPQGNTNEYFEVPESIIRFEDGAIVNSSLKHIHLPSTLNTPNISTSFYQCSSLEKITVSPNSLYYSSDDNGILFDKAMIKLISCPVAIPLTVYTTPISVTTIGKNAFEKCSTLSEIELTEGITAIESAAFQYCSKLASIILPKSLLAIDSYAFYQTTKLTDVYYTGTEEEWNKITIRTSNNPILNAAIHYNFGATSGSCGENALWSFNELNGILTIIGNGEIDQTEAEKYGWYGFKDKILYIEIADDITNVPSNSFKSYPLLTEVYLGKNVSSIGADSFRDCKALRLFTVHSENTVINESSLDLCNDTLTFVCPSSNENIISLATTKEADCITVSFDEKEKILKFNGELTIYNGPRYYFLSSFLNEHTNANYIYFEKLVFNGVQPDLILPDFENSDNTASDLTLTNLYVNLAVVKDGTQENITFEEMLELLESGNYDAFKYIINSDDIDGEKTFLQKVEDFFGNLSNNALRAISSVINFISKLFRKR